MGAAVIALSGPFVKLAAVSPATATFYRCALALPVLGALMYRELRTIGRLSAQEIGIQLIGGVMLGIDFALWSYSIQLIGAGIASVVVNIQVVIVPMLTWVAFGTRVPIRFVIAVPVLLGGIALSSGAFVEAGGDSVIAGTALALSAGVAYAIYLFATGRAGNPGRPASKVFVSTIAAGVAGSAVGSIWGAVDLTPGWISMGSLIALASSAQVVGWILIANGLPKVPAEIGATLLLMQPVIALLASMALLHERPGITQLIGCAVVICAVWVVSVGPGRGRGVGVIFGKRSAVRGDGPGPTQSR